MIVLDTHYSGPIEELFRLPFSILDISVGKWKLIYLLSFFLISAVGIIISKKRSKNILMIVIVSMVLFPGLIGVSAYPFYSWHTFPWDSTETSSYHYIYVSDLEGNELILSKYSDPLFKGVYYQNYGKKLENYDENKQKAFAKYVMDQTQEHQKNINATESSDFLINIPWRHPAGESAPPKWSKNDLEKVGQLKILRVYKITTKTNNRGTKLEKKERDLIFEFVMKDNGEMVISESP